MTARVAVVIPGHNCGRTLSACLTALLPLKASGEVAEIVFVDDHSSDDTRSVASQFPVRLCESPRRGAGAARNVGWRAVDADYIWFVDSDCVAQPEALTRLRATLSQLQADVVGGSYANQSEGSWVAELIHEEMVGRHQAMGQVVTFAITANLLCRRESLAVLSGFDESLRLGQDLDFAYRVVASGRKLGFDAMSRVAHYHETRLLAYLKKQARQGFWRMHLYRRHPRRVSGDTYSGPLDYVQPPLAVLAFAAPVLGVLLGLPWLGSAASALSWTALAACQVPRARAVMRVTGQLRYWRYVPFGVARAAFRGAGMLAGLVSVLGESARVTPPASSRASVAPQ